ncbi:hypothetical protein BKA65DRAFT_515940 [Rhexocercosporidium sp. MPI-PUGE-AT-0058]|nr:hypothetical protein BKA65DRAFT_515940 [Rhexocercosporidium sp. MPI-PUGE-AT-0058]
MVLVVATGAGALAAMTALTKAAAVQVAVATAASEAALTAGAAASAAGALATAEAALAVAIAAENAAIAAAGVTAANVWNPAGWIIGAVLVGASEHTSWAVTWGCYKPIIGEVDTQESSIKPITFADLAAHSEVRRVFIRASTASANLPEVEVENKAGQYYLLRGVVLPWGSVAYHAERISKESSQLSEA